MSLPDQSIRGPFDTRGLTGIEAKALLLSTGPNELPTHAQLSYLKIVAKVLREPMLTLLLLCAVVYLFAGERAESLLILLSVLLVLAISFVQEWRAERSLQALRDLASPKAHVIRDGIALQIPAREVVPGDLMQVFEGQRVPADGTAIELSHLQVDESLLTGEAFPVRKSVEHSQLYSGTLAVSGRAVARVTETGGATEIGKIGKALVAARKEESRLRIEISRLVRVFSILGLLASGGITVAFVLLRLDWTHGILAGLAAAISLLPEEFPVVFSIFLAVGAWRMAKRSVLTRSMPAIETLGEVTILCVDKTGTLTENQMELRALSEWKGSKTYDPAKEAHLESVRQFLALAAFASETLSHDPMDRAIRDRAEPLLTTEEKAWVPIREYPLHERCFAVTYVWQRSDRSIFASSKGAPEAIADLCRLDSMSRERFLESAREMARRGFRVLGVAATGSMTSPTEDAASLGLEPVGLLGFDDPLRPEVPSAVRQCKAAGIRVIMMTGDSPETASNIARSAGLSTPDRVCLGKDVAVMSDSELEAALLRTDVFARMIPGLKLRIVEALKRKNEVVGMTGDGVNDAPALKRADVGIAMGKRGTDVARESADLVLLNDDFGSIVEAVRMGRRIYGNIQKSLTYLLAAHVPIAGLATLPVLFGSPLVLLPPHLVFMELIIDPVFAILFEAEPEEPGTMERPPRSADSRLFRSKDLLRVLFEGSWALIGLLVLDLSFIAQERTPEEARSAVFSALVLSNLSLLLVYRRNATNQKSSTSGRKALVVALVSLDLALLLLLLMVPSLRSLYQLAPLKPADLPWVLSAGLLPPLGIRLMRIRPISHERFLKAEAAE